MFRNIGVVVLSALLLCLGVPSSAAVAPLPVPNLKFGGGYGTVHAIAVLPDASLLVGGDFDEINGVPRAGIARLLADGSLDRAWDAQLSPQFAHVRAIVVDGGFAYIGGIFTTVGGAARQSLARISLSDASLSAAWDAGLNGDVRALAVAGSDLVITGSFSQAGGAPHYALAKASLATGAVSSWTNDLKFRGFQAFVGAIAVDGTNLYVAGSFDEIGGVAVAEGVHRVSLATSNSLDTSWTIPVAAVDDIATDASRVYVAGGFNSVGANPIAYLARASKAAGAAIDSGWNPAPDSSVKRVAIDGGSAFLVGWFIHAGGAERWSIAEVDLSTGAATAWNPADERSAASAVAVAPAAVFVGFDPGTQTSVLRAARGGSGARDASFIAFAGGGVSPEVNSMAFAGDGRTYIGGYFQGIDGYPIANLARLNADGTLDAGWRSNPDRQVLSIALAGNDVIAGGYFERIGGLQRNRIAKIATDVSGTVDLTWNPNADAKVTQVAVDGTDVYAGGEFYTVSGLVRPSIAKLPLAGTGTATPTWNAGWTTYGLVFSILASGGSVYVGGDLPTASGTQSLVKLSSASGAQDMSWNPAPNSRVRDLAIVGSQLYVAGDFARIGGSPHLRLARLDLASGIVDDTWLPVVSNPLPAMAIRNGVVYVAGGFVNGVFTGGSMAAISTATGHADMSWTVPPNSELTTRMRGAQVWLGISGESVLDGREAIVAYPESFCAAAVEGASCGSGMTCQASVCTVPMSATTTSVSISPTRASYGQRVTLTAFVNSPGGTPGGRVTFYGTHGYEIGSATFQSPPGTYSVTLNAYEEVTEVIAMFDGGPGFAPSHSTKAFASVALNSTRNDWDSDNRPDLLYRNTGSGALYVWRMNGTTLASDQYVTTIDPSWSLIGHGDFNGDGKNDMVWRNDATGTAYVWYMNNGVYQSDAFLFTIDPIWKIEAVADFNNDGKPDFFFRHQTSGVGFIWYFDNTTPLNDQFLFSIDNSWIVENVGDFNNDGYPDFFFRNTSTGVGFVWYWNGSSLGASNYMFGIDPKWQVVQIADWNNDGKVDLVFRNRENGVTFVWYTDGTTLQGSDFITQIDPSWEIEPYR